MQVNNPTGSGGAGTVQSDGVTLQGDGSAGNKLAIKAVQTDATITGAGTVASPLSAVTTAANTDGVTIQGNGSMGSPIALLNAQTDGVTMQGAGITASKIAIKAVQVSGGLSGAGTVASPLAYDGTMQTDGVTLQGVGTTGNKVRILAVQVNARLTGAGTVASPLDLAGIPVDYFQAFSAASTSALGGANQVWVNGFTLQAAITFTKLGCYVGTVDAVNAYDIGVYSTAGALLANVGPRTLPASGPRTFAINQTTVTLNPGRYVFAFTGNSTTAKLGFDANSFAWTVNANYVASSAGTLPNSVTAFTVSPAVSPLALILTQ